MWLAHLKNVHFHRSLGYATWPSMVAICFSILTRASLRGASFTHVRGLVQAIGRLIAAHNKAAVAFECTKAAVHPAGLHQPWVDSCR